MSKIGVALLLAACGREAGPSGDEVFHRIQEHEQRVAVGSASLSRTRECEPAREAAEGEVCPASRALCELARDSGDSDAAARCRAASDACGGARERVRQRCATKPPEHGS